MKVFIHAHPNPKITDPMEVYEKQMPEKKDFYFPTSSKEHFYEGDYNEAIDRWQLISLLAYIKEPDFKAGKSIYVNGDKDLKYTFFEEDGCKKQEDMYSFFIWLLKTKKGIQNIRFISHYHEGQQIDPDDFKYVKEEMCFDCGGDGKETFGNYKTEEEDYILDYGKPHICLPGLHKVLNGGDCKTCNGTGIEWQEVKEPIMRIDFIIDPKFTQFHKECREGTILLTPR